MRMPFFKQSHNAWYWHNGKKLVRLGKKKDEAFAEWGRQQTRESDAPTEPVATEMKTSKLIDVYLEWVGREENRSKSTHVSYTRTLAPLKELCGSIPAEQLRAKDLDKVIKERLTTYRSQDGVLKRYSETSRWHFFKAAMAAFNWAKDQGHIASHFLVKLKDRPECGVRQEWITQEQFDQLIAACDEPLLKDLLIALWQTGARPFELLQARAEHIDHKDRCLRFFRAKGDKVKAKRKKRDATRTVQLSEEAYKIVCAYAAKHPEGLLFRNSWGNAWTAGLLGHRLEILRKRTGIQKLTPYVLRHSFCTRLVLKNVNAVIIKDLMGHSDLKMISSVYSHLNQSSETKNGILDNLAG